MTDLERKIARSVKIAVAASDYNAKTVAELIGISYPRLHNIVNGRTPATPSVLRDLRQILNMPEEWPEETNEFGAMPGERVTLAGTKMSEIPVVGDVAAGVGVRNVDVERRTVWVPDQLKKLGSIGFIIDGDSMLPMLHQFDTAVFREFRQPRTGYPFLIRTDKDGDRCKVLIYERGEWYLESLNRKYKREKFPSGAEIIGILVGYFRTHGSSELMFIDPDGIKAEGVFNGE